MITGQRAVLIGPKWKIGSANKVKNARSGAIASILAYPRRVRLSPDSDRTTDIEAGPVGANSSDRQSSLDQF
jgi:hypothetical protein